MRRGKARGKLFLIGFFKRVDTAVFVDCQATWPVGQVEIFAIPHGRPMIHGCFVKDMAFTGVFVDG